MAARTLLLAVAATLVAAAAAGTWKVIDSGIATTDAGIGFASETVGYTAGDGNGVGPEIWKTTDGGATWNQQNASFGLDVLLLGLAASGNSAVVTSIAGEMFTADGGKTWGHSVGGGESQSAHRFIGDTTGTKFGVTGSFFGTQGVAVSSDSGRTFKKYSAGLFTEARYGAFASDNIWYCAGGQWPDNSERSPRQRSMFQDANGKFPLHYQKPTKLRTDGYMAQLTRTTDGGKTWTTVFAENGTFYFNGVDCNPTNPNHCCAVGEASDSSAAGARIYCTTDGLHWNRTFYSPETTKEGFSLMEIRFAGPNDIWAAGGELASIAPSAWFLHSVDGGATWVNNQKPIFGSMVLALDMVDATTGYAALDNVITQTANIAKFS